MRNNNDIGFADRLDLLEKDFDVVADTIEALVESLNLLDVQHERLHYKLQYVMDNVVVQRKDPRAILDANGNAPAMRASLTEFFVAEGERYIAALKAQADALQAQLAKQAAGAANVNQVIRDTIRDIRAANPRREDPAEGDGASEAKAGPRLVTAQA